MSTIDKSLWDDKCDYFEPKALTQLNPKNNNLTILQLNIRSLLSKQSELNSLLNTLHSNKNSPNLLLLSETHLTESKMRHVNLPNYKLICQNRTSKQGGGVAIAVHNSLKYKEREDLKYLNKSFFECIIIEIKMKSLPPVLVCSLYRPPNTKSKEFLKQYKLLLNAIEKTHKGETIIRMDHNLDLLKANIHEETQEFLDINFEKNILPCITRPTRITKSTATLIDNIFISQHLHNSFDSSILISDISDHMPSIVNIHDQKLDNTKSLEFKCRSLNEKTKITELNNLLSVVDWSTLHSNNVDVAFNQFQSKIEESLDKIAPYKHITIPNHKMWKEPWITKGLSNSMNKCIQLYKKTLIKNAPQHTYNKYKIYRNCLTKIKRNAKVSYYIQKCYSLKSNVKKLWQLINNIIKKTNDKTTLIDYITIYGVECYDPHDISNHFGKFYSKLGENVVKSIPESKLTPNHYLSKLQINPKTLYLHQITPSEIKKYINKLPSKDSSGYDNISNKLLKQIKYSILKPLAHIFNLSIVSGVFPANMKLSEIIPLYKKGTKDLMNNYRPISLLLTISKLLGKCMYTRLYKFITKNNIFYNKQYGFRNNHSCEQAIQNLYGHILQNKEDGIQTSAVFLDLSKAFDTISHDLLLEKLEKYGIRGLSNEWIKSYISNRCLQVKCLTLSCNKPELSNKYNINHGTAQGSCLGPLLFNLFCNDLYLNLEYCNIIMFADDITLYASHRNTHYLNYILQTDLKTIEDWLLANKLSLNISKTYAMKFNVGKEENNKKLSLQLNDTVIPLVTSTKFLGVTIDEDLNWTKHINNIISKISVNKNLIGRTRNILNSHAKKCIYYSHIFSHISYANTIWSSSVSCKQNKAINTIQKYCIKAIHNKSKRTPSDPLFKSSKIMKFNEIRKFELCKLAHKLKENELPTPLADLFNNSCKKTHRYCTRFKQLPNIKKHTSTNYNNSFLCKSLTYYNELDLLTRRSKHIHEFTQKYKTQLFK